MLSQTIRRIVHIDPNVNRYSLLAYNISYHRWPHSIKNHDLFIFITNSIWREQLTMTAIYKSLSCRCSSAGPPFVNMDLLKFQHGRIITYPVGDVITFPLPNFNNCTVKFGNGYVISQFIQLWPVCFTLICSLSKSWSIFHKIWSKCIKHCY